MPPRFSQTDLSEIELYATMDRAKEVGGDFYDFFRVDFDHFAVVVGDVSGKGVPASLFMVVAKTLLKNAAMHNSDVADMFEQVNRQLCAGNESGLFVTCWMGILQVSSGELRFVNAGHAQPIWYHEGAFSYINTKPNLMLGAMEGIPYVEHTMPLSHGDRLFIYTDGVTEATSAEEELFGEARMTDALNAHAQETPEEIVHGVRQNIDAFVKDAPQFDDITMLCMRFH